jgi:hypothetical protein
MRIVHSPIQEAVSHFIPAWKLTAQWLVHHPSVCPSVAPLIGRVDAIIGQAKAEAGHVDAQQLLEQRQRRDCPAITVVQCLRPQYVLQDLLVQEGNEIGTRQRVTILLQ